jgi:hypothetical protein
MATALPQCTNSNLLDRLLLPGLGSNDQASMSSPAPRRSCLPAILSVEAKVKRCFHIDTTVAVNLSGTKSLPNIKTTACAFRGKGFIMHGTGSIFPPGCIVYVGSMQRRSAQGTGARCRIHNVLSYYCTVNLDRLTSLTCARLASVRGFEVAVTGS